MRVLFLHQNAPGQFGRLSGALAARGHDVMIMGQHQRRKTRGVDFVSYAPSRLRPVHNYLADLNSNSENGRAVFDAIRELAARGWIPELVVGHNGWGEMLFVKDAIPQARTLGYFEFFYRQSGQDVAFDPEFPENAEDNARLKMRNLTNLLGLVSVDRGWSPTQWQRGTYPAEWRNKISVVHDGIDTQYMSPLLSHSAPFTLPDGKQLSAGTPLITFVARNLEPYRGFHVFARTIDALLKRIPDAHVVIVGGTSVSYGPKPKEAPSWKEVILRDHPIDSARVSFVGHLSYAELRTLFRISSAHVYMTYPFVLSWSVLEAMACGAVVVASRTAPVTEVISDGENGLLFDFFDRDGLVDRVAYAVKNTSAAKRIRRSAREDVVTRFDFTQACLPAQLQILSEVAGAAL